MDVLERSQRREAKGRLIRRLREEKGYSQQSVANAIGVVRSTIQKVENGETGTKDTMFWEFLELVEVSEPEFYHMLESEIDRPLGDEEARIDSELGAVLKYNTPLHIKRILHSVFCRKWGGDVERLMDLVACHRDLSLMQRLHHSQQYVSEYRLDGELGILQNQGAGLEPPDVERLDRVNKVQARTALLDGKDGYA